LFDKINAGLSKLVDKISKTEIKEKKLDNFLDEFELILIQNDVAVPVVDSLSSELKKKIKTEQVRRFGDVREPVKKALRNVLLDKLKVSKKVDFFEILESKKKQKEPLVIVFVGINGTGKCVAGDSLISISKNESRPIEEIYDEMARTGTQIDDVEGTIVTNKKSNISMPSVDFQQFGIKEAIPSFYWKLKNNGPLLSISLKNGSNIQVTPEHPFFTKISGRTSKINAIDLTENSHILITEERSNPAKFHRKLNWAGVERIDQVDGIKYVYDFTIPSYHNFIANDIVVHNTTSIAKLANILSKKGYSSVIACCDTYRPGSIEQLEEHARNVGVRTIKHGYGADAAAVAFDAIKYAKSKGLNTVLIDTAGRMQTNKNLIDEMKKIVKISNPDLKILVVDALTGNDATEQGKIFNEAIKLDGIILAKLDADAKGGSAISLSHITEKPIIFIGTGQKYDDLMEFNPEFIVDNIIPK